MKDRFSGNGSRMMDKTQQGRVVKVDDGCVRCVTAPEAIKCVGVANVGVSLADLDLSIIQIFF